MSASIDELQGAMLPEGILVDETAAYFGHTGNSDIIGRLHLSDRLNALGEFLSLTSDLLLTDMFDIDAVSRRLGCEAGEIYYLLSGPLKLLTISDPLRRYLGLEDSNGDISQAAAEFTADEFALLDSFNDPFKLLKIFAIGHTCGGLQELDLYLANFEEWLQDVASNRMQLYGLNQQIEQVSLEIFATGEAASLTVLSGGVQIRASIPEPPAVENVETASASSGASDVADIPATKPQGETPHTAQPVHHSTSSLVAASAAPSVSNIPDATTPQTAAVQMIAQAPSPTEPAALQPRQYESPPSGQETTAPTAVAVPTAAPTAIPIPIPAAAVPTGDVAAQEAFSAAFQGDTAATNQQPIQSGAESAPATNLSGATSGFTDAFGGISESVAAIPPTEAQPIHLDQQNQPAQPHLAEEKAAPLPQSQSAVFGQVPPNMVAAAAHQIAAPSFGQLGGQAPTTQPTSFGIVPTSQTGVSPRAQATASSNGHGKIRNASVAGVHHIIQTGVYCGGCGIGVEHHWRHCPLCAVRLI